MEAVLTIAIPTYNRPKHVYSVVKRLLPQLEDDCVLKIYDNCSDKPVVGVISDLLDKYPAVKIQVIRNAVNIGAIGNVIRCMEQCDTKWLVMCGDDDPPDLDHVAKVKRAIVQYSEAVFISFLLGDEQRPRDFTTNGINGFVRGDYIFGTVLSISCGVYRMEALRHYMSIAYFYAYTSGPHMALLIKALVSNGGQCVFVSRRLADCSRDFSLESWTRFWLTSLSLLLELIPNAADRRAFGQKITPYMSSQTYMANKFIENALLTNADNTFSFTVRMKLRSLAISSPAMAMKQFFFMWLVKHPRFGLQVMKILSAKRRRPEGYDSSCDDFYRRI
jgi:glycosyltransferase involved in cell wall biosynthesis